MGEVRSIKLDASAQKAALRIRVSDSHVPAAATLMRLRDSLAAFYGERGLLQTQPLRVGAETVLEVPLESPLSISRQAEK
jgi:hypothetical protein